VVDRADELNQCGATAKSREFDAAVSLHHSAIGQVEIELLAEYPYRIVHVIDNVCNVVNVFEHSVSSLGLLVHPLPKGEHHRLDSAPRKLLFGQIIVPM
jgi:hypothetical protein